MSTVPSATEQMRTILFNRMNRDESADKYDNALLLQVATDSAVRIQQAAGKAAQSLTATLDSLTEQGYDKDHKVHANQIDVNDKINGVLVKLAEAAARQL